MKIYLSIPINYPIEKVNEVQNLIKRERKTNIEFVYWIRGTYYDEEHFRNEIESSDVFIVFTDENRYEPRLSELSLGCNAETKIALKAGIDVCFAYKRVTTETMGIFKVRKPLFSGKTDNILTTGDSAGTTLIWLKGLDCVSSLGSNSVEKTKTTTEIENRVSNLIILAYQ